jgi:hypothetical protein
VPPASRGEDHARRPIAEQRGHEIDRDVEARGGRHGEHVGAELLDQRRLDLVLALAAIDPLLDELALVVGDLRGRDVEDRAALHAHDLVLDVGQRGLRRRGAGGARHSRTATSATSVSARALTPSRPAAGAASARAIAR